MTETTKTKSSSSPVLPNGADSNPFSLETTRARRAERFPEIGLESLSAREAKIYQQARAEILAIGLIRIKGQFATRETATLESIAHERFFATTATIERRQQEFQAHSQNDQFQTLTLVFAFEGVKRMGGAIAGIVDAVECQMLDIVDQAYEFDQPHMSLVARIFSGRR